MTHEELFIMMSLRIGNPKPMLTSIIGNGKAAIPKQQMNIDQLCEFVSLAAMNNYPLNNEREVRALWARYEDWYKRNIPSEK